MNRKISIGVALAVMIIVVALTVSATMLIAMRQFNSQVTALGERQKMYNYLSEVDNAVQQNYFYKNIDSTVLRRGIARGYIAGTEDPYAQYLSPADYAVEAELLEGRAYGYGISVQEDADKQIRIVEVQPDSPAYSAGLLKNDIVIALDTIPLEADGLSKVVKKLSEVNATDTASMILKIKREETEIAVELSAATYNITSVESRMIDDIGYIRIKSFNAATDAQFKIAYTALTDAGATGIILDLRNNRGGLLASAQNMLSYLLSRGLYAYYSYNTGRIEMKSDEMSYSMSLPAVSLVNENTAGEAELVAAVLSQSVYTPMIGRHTAGRSFTQKYFPLTSDKSAVKISVAQMSLIDGSNWEDNGLRPAVDISLTEEKMARFDTLTDEEDTQLQTALNRLAGGSYNPKPTEPTEPTDVTGTTETGEEGTEPTDAAD